MTKRIRPDAGFVAQQAARMKELLQQRATIPREDFEYLVEHMAKLKDERLRSAVAGLIGWGDDERAEIETFVAVAIEVMKKANVSKLREAAQTVELRYLVKANGELNVSQDEPREVCAGDQGVARDPVHCSRYCRGYGGAYCHCAELDAHISAP